MQVLLTNVRNPISKFGHLCAQNRQLCGNIIDAVNSKWQEYYFDGFHKILKLA